MSRRISSPAFALAVALLLSSTPAAAVEKNVAFALDQWIDLNVTEGPVTLHRIRLASQSGVTKSKIFRPGGSMFTTDVQIQLEFTNQSTDDYEARIRFEWLDAAGVAIDGYDGTESLDNEARFEQQTMTISTLRYGLDKAKKIRLAISTARD